MEIQALNPIHPRNGTSGARPGVCSAPTVVRCLGLTQPASHHRPDRGLLKPVNRPYLIPRGRLRTRLRPRHPYGHTLYSTLPPIPHALIYPLNQEQSLPDKSWSSKQKYWLVGKGRRGWMMSDECEMMNRTAKQQICEACIGPVTTGQTGRENGYKDLKKDAKCRTPRAVRGSEYHRRTTREVYWSQSLVKTMYFSARL